ncbi:MAG: glucokinase [Nitrospinota bacterium]
MILAADIGGTKTLLALYDLKESRLEKVSEARFQNRNYTNFESVLDEYFEKGLDKPEIACLGVAGPISNGACELTNLDWRIDQKQLEKYFKRVFLINDLVAMACATPFLKEDAFFVLQAGSPKEAGRISVVAAGTGLGQAFLVPVSGDKYQVIDSEGGHADFTPRNELETKLLFFLQKEFSRVSVERVVSGPGLIYMFEFFKKNLSIKGSEDWEKGLGKEKLASEIIRRGMEGQSEACEKTMGLFVELYGALAGNLALQFMSKGGVFLGGGIAPKILPLLGQGTFMDSFLSKGRFKKFLTDIPVKVILDDKAPLLGAAQFALGNKFVC